MGATNAFSGSNQRFTDFDTSFIFLRNNKFETGDFSNPTGAAVTIEAGTVLGRIHATGKIVAMASGLTNGAELPIGVLAQTVTVPATDESKVTYCIAGEVAQEKIILDGTDTLETVVANRRYIDRIPGDTAGIILIEGTELTAADNS